MKQPNRFIFRSTAVKHYLQSRERDVFPRLLSPFVFGFYWLLLSLLLLAIGIAWWGEVPVYAFGSGLLLTTTTKYTSQSGQNEMQALVFVPVIAGQPELHLSRNTPILLESSTAGLRINGEITSIDPDIVSPQTAQKRYKLSGDTSELILQPSLVLHAHITTDLPAALYAGSIVHASIQSGSQRLLSLLPGVSSLLGDA